MIDIVISVLFRAVHESVCWTDTVGRMDDQGLLPLVQLSVRIGQNRSNRFVLESKQFNTVSDVKFIEPSVYSQVPRSTEPKGCGWCHFNQQMPIFFKRGWSTFVKRKTAIQTEQTRLFGPTRTKTWPVFKRNLRPEIPNTEKTFKWGKCGQGCRLLKETNRVI